MFSGKLKRIDLILIQVFLFITPFMFGLIYEFTAYFAQIFLLVILLIIILKQKKLKIYFNVSSISILLITLGYLFTCFYAIDKGMSFLGFLKFTIPLTFAIILMQYKKPHINKMFEVIPIAGVLMIILSALFRYLPFLPDYFYLPSGRMGGFFQYSNTFALFLLIGIICSINSKKSDIKTKIIITILLIGIFMTGSRTVFILTILSFVFFIIKFKNMRKYLISLFGIGVIITLIYAGITNNFNTIARYLTTSLNSSTLWGRILYYKDAIIQIIHKPFGLGYMGYSYIQTSIQTGVYSTLYVHNEFLQLALDIGIIPMAVFIFAIIKSLVKGNISTMQKQILLIIFLHILFDFDLQFIYIFLILVMTLDITSGKKIVFNVNRYGAITGISILSIIYLYFAICTFLQYLGKSDISTKMYPFYTDANVNIMCDKAEEDLTEANKIADKILKTNNNVYMAYNVKALYNVQNENWRLMVQNKQKSIELNKYDANNYEEYILMLSMAIDYYANIDDMANCMKYIELVVQVPSKIEQVMNSTSSIAYKLQDTPNIELSDDVQNYINNMKGVLENEKD